MNFHIEQALASGGRLGRITQIGHGRTVTLETPMCSLFTKGGSAPHLSLSMLAKIKRIPEIATMSMNSFVDSHDSIHECGKGLSGFTAMKDKLIFSTLHDASSPVPSGKNDKSGVAVWGKGGKVMLNPTSYVAMQESFRPDWVVALGDGDTDQDCGEKRAGKAVDRTLDFLDIIVAAWKKSEVLKSSSLIGVIVGGFSERHRQRSAAETSTRPVHGFLLEGFHKAGSKDDKMFENDAFVQILTKTISYLPESKPRIMECPWSPVQVIHAFKLGIDVFSSAYPHTLSEKGLAMIQDYSLPSPPPSSSPTEDLENEKENVDTNTSTNTPGPVIDLNDKRYFEDFGPLMSGCQCYTCSTFTRSYIHHLLNTSELLAYVLLTIHNFERYFEFFHTLRQVASSGRLDELEKKLSNQENK